MCEEKDYQSVDVVVMINSGYEDLGIYKELTEKGYEYQQDFSGPLKTIGYVADRPICVAPLIHKIGGANVLHVEATSQLVDWVLIYAWVRGLVPVGTQIFDGPTNLIVNFRHYAKKVKAMK